MSSSQREVLGFTPYQWLVIFAAWLGWGFDVFDALLFNYVARLCVPSLLGVGADQKHLITQWVGILTSVLLIGWALGGILFGKITDRIGRTKTLLLTMMTYALATAACAFAPNIWVLMLFRFIASLGIGGEWAAGAALVAETVPEKKRVAAGALLYTAAPAGLFLATFVTDLFTRQLTFIASDPNLSWRAVFLTGLIPAAVALLIRLKVREPEGWSAAEEKPKIAELFSPAYRRRTIGGLVVALVALITWWSCNAFVPTIASFLAQDQAAGISPEAGRLLQAQYITISTTSFNLGGLIGTLLTIPIAVYCGRRPMFIGYFAASAVSIWLAFQGDFHSETRLYILFFVGLTVFGVFGSFTFYLPELFPMRLRGTGSGFCYNTGRLITAVGPFLVGAVASSASTSEEIMTIVSWVAAVPLAGCLLVMAGLGEETKGQALESQS
ncbi:MAG: MFS transporter [Deltaproteobacteria bacterium]|nr:MFS transporter [Deltaproteobacteria bacterium]